jgi:signal transduction histidine kinase/ligand-binding sensor domain-containing protein
MIARRESAAATPRSAGVVARALVVALVSCVGTTLPPSTAAQPEIPPNIVPGYTRDQWSVKEGAPTDVRALVQGTDGLLWVGTRTGLYRFDGVSFERHAPPLDAALPSNNIGAMWSLRNGDVWIASTEGRVTLLAQGRVARTLSMPPNHGFVRHMIADASDNAYVVATSGLFAIEPSGIRAIGTDSGLPGARCHHALFASDGTLWVVMSAGIFRRPPGETRFIARSSVEMTTGTLSESHDGTIWYTDEDNTLTRVQGDAPVRSFPTLGGYYSIIDRHDTMWVDSTLGTRRVALDDPPRALDEPSGATAGGVVRAILQDREGNVWIGSTEGIARLRHDRLTEPAHPGGTGGVAAAVGGGAWLVSYTRGLMRAGVEGASIPAVGPRLTAVHRDRQGALWLGGQRREELERVVGDTVTRVPLPPALGDSYVAGIVDATNDDLWVMISPSPPGGMWRMRENRWEKQGGIAGLPPDSGTALDADAQGRVWIGYIDGRIAIVENDAAILLASDDGFAFGAVRGFATRDGVVLAGGDNGVAWFDGAHFRELRARPGEAFLGVSNLLFTPDGDAWINQSDGLLRVPAAEIALAMRDATHFVQSERFDYRDGRVGTAISVAPRPSIAVADDGKIWVAAGNLTHIDPVAIARNTIAPEALIRTVSANGMLMRPVANRVELPEGTRDLAIGYMGNSLTMPERMRFRYRLAGVDSDWRDGDTLRRTVSYANLSAGAYRFELLASNNDGVWSTAPGVAVISIAPRYYETLWFRVASIVAALALLLLAFRLRSRMVAERVRERLRERSDERERIARELHDTLLQGVQGLILHFQAIADDIDPTDPNRASMETALDRADALMKEARDRVSDLRFARRQPDFASYFRAMVPAGATARLRVRESGRRRDVAPVVHVELLRIGQEAVTNAYRHSQATRISVDILHRPQNIRMRIRDDGNGIPLAVAAAGGRDGHFGLTGMRERARKLGARLSIGTAKGGGTAVDLLIPASVAYARGRRLWLSRLWWRLREGFAARWPRLRRRAPHSFGAGDPRDD